MTSPVTSPSTLSRFAPLAEPLLPSPAHSQDEAQQLALFLELFHAKVRWQAAPPTINSTKLIKAQNTHQAVSTQSKLFYQSIL